MLFYLAFSRVFKCSFLRKIKVAIDKGTEWSPSWFREVVYLTIPKSLREVSVSGIISNERCISSSSTIFLTEGKKILFGGVFTRAVAFCVEVIIFDMRFVFPSEQMSNSGSENRQISNRCDTVVDNLTHNNRLRLLYNGQRASSG